MANITKGTEQTLLITVVNKGFDKEIVGLIQSAVANVGATILDGRAIGQQSSFMGISVTPDREIILVAMDASQAAGVMSKISAAYGVTTPANGICFNIPLDKVTKSK
jgi:hypothetical protein